MATTINFPSSPTIGQLYVYGVTTYVWEGTRWSTKLQITDDVISGSLRVTNGITGSLFGTASYAITASYAQNAGVTVNTGSLLLTASAALNTITFTKGDGTTFPITVNTGSGGGITGTGITNYIPKFTGTSAIGNSLLYDNGTTVSVNTTAPASTFKFEVSGSDIQVNGVRVGAGGGGKDSNAALGFYALLSNTSGVSNTAVGSQALSGNNAGFGHTGVGALALSNVTGGYYNIGIGWNTQTLTATDTYSIVIGAEAIGLGTNTTVIGYSGTTLTAIRGNIALGKNSANARLDVSGSAIITGSLRVTQGITGSLFGTASFATSASYAPNNGYVTLAGIETISGLKTFTTVNRTIFQNADSLQAIFTDGTGELQVGYNSTEGRITSKGSLNFITNYPTNAAPSIVITSTGNIALGKTFANARLDISGSALISGSLNVSAGITGSLFGTASQAVSASWAPVAATVATASFVTASNVYGPFGSNSILSSSFASTASYAPLYLPLTGGTIDGNVTVNGTASIAFLNVTYESASVIYSSGSNVFGDATNDTQTLVGTVLVSGSQQITGSLNVNGGITGSLFGTASFAATASLAPLYLPLTGGTLSGNLTIQKTAATLNITSTGAGEAVINLAANTTGTKDAVIDTSTAQGGSGDLVLKAAGTERIRIKGSTASVIITGSLEVTNGITGSLFGTASFATTASFVNPLNQTVIVTGSLRGNVISSSIASTTASLDLATSNFFTLTLANGANTHISASNILPGQTANIRVTQGSAGTGTVSFNSAIKQSSGSLYTGSMIANAVDVVSLIAFDQTNAYISYINNFV